MKKSDSIFTAREMRLAAGFVVIYAALAVSAQVLTPEDQASPTLHLRPAVSADAALEGVVEASPLESLPTDTVTLPSAPAADVTTG
jgi:hypothetical protein